MRISQTFQATGSGSGPTLQELKSFLKNAENWPAQSRVRVSHHDSRDPREGSTWTISVSAEHQG